MDISFKHTLWEVIHETRSVSPQSKIFISLFLFLKFIGIITLSNSLEANWLNNISFYDFFSNFSYYNKLSRKPINYLMLEVQSFILYFLLIFPILIFVSWHYYHKSKKALLSRAKFSPRIVKLIKFVYILFTWIVWFSDIINEILGFNFVFLIPSDSWKELGSNVSKEKDNLWYLNSLQIILNSLFIVLTNFYVFLFFKVNSAPFLSEKYNFKYDHNSYFLYIFVFLCNVNIVHYYPSIISPTSFQTIITSIILVLLIILLMIHVKDYISFTLYNCILWSWILFSLYGGIIALIVHYTNIQVTISFWIFKYLIDVAWVFSTLFFIFRVQRRIFQKTLITNILSLNRIRNPNYVWYWIDWLQQSINNLVNTSEISTIWEEHKQVCIKGAECEANIINIPILFSQSQKENMNIEIINSTSRIELFKKNFNIIWLWVENEILNYWAGNSVNEAMNSSNNLKIILKLCDFTGTMKLNTQLCLFLIHHYLNKIPNLPFDYEIYWNTLKEEILQQKYLFNTTNELYYKRELNEGYEKCYNHYLLIEDIKNFLKWSVNDYKSISALKLIFTDNKNKNSTLKNIIKSKKNLQLWYDTGMRIESSLNKLELLLETRFYQNKSRISNPEICYLLTNFYTIINKKLPKKITQYIIPIESYSLVDDYETAFNSINFTHPMIINLSKQNIKSGETKNSITYISQKLVDYLGYTNRELINKDFHVWLPPQFAYQHELMMKKSLLIKQEEWLEKGIFLMDKNHFYIKSNIKVNFIPNIGNELLLICNIVIEPANNNSFTFVWDSKTYVIAMSSNFTEYYGLTYDMLNTFEITFCNFFGLNYEKLNSNFLKYINQIETFNNKGVENLMKVSGESKLQEKMKLYECTDEQALGKIPTQKISISKNGIAGGWNKMKKIIESQEYNSDWIERIDELFNKLSINTETIRANFEFYVKLNKIGNIPYYIVNVHETIYKNPESNMMNYNNWVNILSSEEENLRKNIKGHEPNKTIIAKNNWTSFTKNMKNEDSLLNDYMYTNTHQTGTKQNLFNDSQQGWLNNSVIFMTTKKEIPVEVPVPKNNFSSLGRLNKMQSFGYYCSIIFIIVLIFMLAFNFYFKGNLFNLIEDTLNSNTIAIGFKQYATASSIAALSGVFLENDLEDETFDGTNFNRTFMKSLISVRSASWFDEYNSWCNFISKYLKYDLISKMNDELYLDHNFTLIDEDFKIHTYTSNFNDELHYYHFTMGILRKDNMLLRCNILDYYIYKNILNTTVATYDDIFAYYITHNVPGQFLDTIEQLILIANQFFTEQYQGSQSKVNVFNIALLLIGVILISIQVFLIVINKHWAYIYFQTFFTKSNDAISIWDIKLGNLNTILLTMDKEVCEKYEELNEEIKLNKDKNRSTSMFYTPLRQVGDDAKDTSHKKKKSKRETKQKINKNNAVKKPIEEEEEDNQGKTRISIFSLKMFKISFAIVSMSFLIHSTLMILNVIYSQDWYNTINFMINMSNAFLDIVPSYNEIILYFRVSVLFKDYWMITRSREEYSNFVEYFQDSSETELRKNIINYIDKDKRYITWSHSKMAFLYYRLYYENELITKFETSSRNNLLSQRNAFSLSLQKEGACEIVADSYTKYIFNFEDGLDRDTIENACMSLDQGVNNNSPLNSLWNFYSYLLDEFTDFVNIQSTMTSDQQWSTLRSRIFLSVTRQMIFVINIIWAVTKSLIKQDISNSFATIRNTEFIFQFLGLFIWIILIIILWTFIMYQLKNNVKVFGKIICKINRSLD